MSKVGEDGEFLFGTGGFFMNDPKNRHRVFTVNKNADSCLRSHPPELRLEHVLRPKIDVAGKKAKSSESLRKSTTTSSHETSQIRRCQGDEGPRLHMLSYSISRTSNKKE